MTFVTIKNLSLGFLQVYIGQIVSCYSDGAPIENITYMINVSPSVVLNDTSKTRKNRLEIYFYTPISDCVIECIAILTFHDGRTPVQVNSTNMYYIRNHVYFHFKNLFKDVYYINEFASCQFITYFDGFITVKKIDGPGGINTLPGTNFSTNVTVGGLYIFLCKLHNRRMESLFYQYHQFEIYYMPTFICLRINYPSFGSFLYCGHNGYPPDQVSYNILLIADGETLVSSSLSYIHIPYLTTASKIIFICNITMFTSLSVQNLHLKKYFVIEKDPTMNMGFTDRDERCTKLIDDPITNAIQISTRQFVFSAEIFTLRPGIIYPFSEILPFVLFCMTNVIIFSIICLRRHVFTTERDVHLILQRRIVNDKLNELARTLQDADRAIFNLYVLPFDVLSKIESASSVPSN